MKPFAVPERALVLIAGAVVALVLVAVVFMASTSSTFSYAHGCGYDGADYCAMARGHEAHLPFNRRVLLPAVAGALTVGSLPARFRLIDFVALAFAAWLTGLLTRRLAMATGVDRGAAVVGGVLAGALVVLSPDTAHIAIWNPAGTDIGALAIGMAWLVLATSPSPSLRWWAVPAAAAAILSREAWVLPIAAGSVATLWLRPPAWIPVVGQLVAAAAAAVFAFTRPGLPLTPNIVRMMHILLERHFGSGSRGLADVTWSLLFAMGILPVLFVRRSRPRLHTSDGPRALFDVVAVVALIHLLQAIVGSTTTARAALPVLPLLLAAAVALSLRLPYPAVRLALAVLGTVLVWQPFHVLHDSAAGYFAFCCPEFSGGAGSRLGSTVLVVLPIMVGLVALSLAKAGDRNSDEPEPV